MKFAFHFPGQGSQSLGMLSTLSTQYPVVEEIFERASSVLNYDVWSLTQRGPEEMLNQTEFTQPALLAADIAVWECWKEEGGAKPCWLAGHSLGEYAALVAANAISFEAAIKLVALRGRAMQAAVPQGQGAMAAIVGLENEVVQAICDEASQGDVVSPANFNSIGQIVIAGAGGAVNRAVILAQEKGATMAKQIPVSVPSHCALMKPAMDALAEKLKTVDVKTPEIPVIHNVDVSEHSSADDIRDALAKQLIFPVRWVEIVQKMELQGAKLFIECGPGKILSGLNKRIVKNISTEVINTPENLQSVVESIQKEG